MPWRQKNETMRRLTWLRMRRSKVIEDFELLRTRGGQPGVFRDGVGF